MHNDYFIERSKLNSSIEDFKIADIISIYRKKIDTMDDSDRLKKFFVWDYQMIVKSEYAMSKRYNKNYEPILFEEDEANIDERIRFYDGCLNESKNIEMKIIYLDYLIENGDKKKRFDYARQLVNNLINSSKIDDYKNSTDCLDFIYKVSRAVEIVTSFGMKEKIEKIECIILKEIYELTNLKEFRWILEISEILRNLCYKKKEKNISKESISSTIEALYLSKRFYKEEKNMNLHQAFCWEILEWIKKENSSDENINNLLLEIGKSYEDEAEYQGGRIEKSYHVKAHFLEMAVNHYIKIGAREKVYELKVKIKESYKLGKDEVKEQKYNIDIPNYDLIEKHAEEFIFENIDKSLQFFSRINYFTPEKKYIIEEAHKRQQSSLMNLVSISKISGDRKVFDANGEDERTKYFIYEEYGMKLQLLFSIMYDMVWIKLLEQGLTCEMLIKRITDWEYMREEDAQIISIGIERYFEDDFISAIHILTPKFESCFREFFTWGGYATTSIKYGGTQHEQNFNEFMRNDFVRNNIDENTLFLIEYIMIDNLGYNLRNDIAHGLAGLEKFNKNTANMIIYLFFVLTNLYWKIEENK